MWLFIRLVFIQFMIASTATSCLGSLNRIIIYRLTSHFYGRSPCLIALKMKWIINIFLIILLLHSSYPLTRLDRSYLLISDINQNFIILFHIIRIWTHFSKREIIHTWRKIFLTIFSHRVNIWFCEIKLVWIQSISKIEQNMRQLILFF